MHMPESIESILYEWIDEWVIGKNFCPFAKPVRVQDSIRIAISAATRLEDMLISLDKECKHLIENPNTATTLVAFPNGRRLLYFFRLDRRSQYLA